MPATAAAESKFASAGDHSKISLLTWESAHQNRIRLTGAIIRGIMSRAIAAGRQPASKIEIGVHFAEERANISQTPAAVQAVLGTNAMNAVIIRADEVDGVSTAQGWTVCGNADAAGRTRRVTTVASDSAATQAASILTQLRA